mgnify:CR=1 FL=1
MTERKPTFLHDEDIQAKLDKKLGPEYISKRTGFGKNMVAYLEGWRAINLANQIFGYNGWSTEVKGVTIDFLDERQGKFSIGCSAIIRVTLNNGAYREDVGYGVVENERRKAAAFERAKKAAVTDGLKRALKSYGNALGNCLYDKDFLSKIDKVKFDPPDFDEGSLFRPSDEINEMSRANTVDGGSGNSNLPNKRRQLNPVPAPRSSGRTNPVMHQQTTAPAPKPQMAAPVQNSVAKPLAAPRAPVSNIPTRTEPTLDLENDELLDDSFTMSDDFQDDDILNMTGNRSKEVAPVEQSSSNVDDNPVAFVTAKGATSLQNRSTIAKENMFDPTYNAQSIKHTIDQTTSKHVPNKATKEEAGPGSRDSMYAKFAAKGKQLDIQQGSATSAVPPNGAPVAAPTLTTPNITPAQPTASNSNRFAPPSTVTRPNVQVNQLPPPNTGRREVGRPKINPLNMKRSNP